jgi:hypothetical protein
MEHAAGHAQAGGDVNVKNDADDADDDINYCI